MPAYREPPQRSDDADPVVVIGQYIDAIDAEMARTCLESHGIEAFVVDVMSFNPLLSGLAGGIQLKVRESDAERAASLLGHMQGPDKNDGNEDDDGEEGEVRCPRCELAYCFFEHSRPEGKGAVSLPGLAHYLVGRARPKRWRCHRCLHEWDDAEEGPAEPTRLHPDDPRPVFRLRRARRGMGLFLGLFAGIGVSAAAALAGYPIGGFAMFIGPILGVWIGGMSTHDACSQPGCRAPLAPGVNECPRCRGTVAGVIRYAHEHYSEVAQVRRELAALRAKPGDEEASEGKGERKKRSGARRGPAAAEGEPAALKAKSNKASERLRLKAEGGRRQDAKSARKSRVVWGALVLALVAGLGWIGFTDYLGSPARRGRVGLEQARAKEASGDFAAAEKEYLDVIQRYAGVTDVSPATERLAGLLVARLGEPCSLESPGRIEEAAKVWRGLRASVRDGAPARAWVDRMIACADQIGEATEAHRYAGLAVLDAAVRGAGDGPEKDRSKELRTKKRLALADALAKDWPLRALELYLAPPVAAGGIKAARQVIEGLGDAPSLWVEAEPEISAWLEQAADIEHEYAAGAIKQKMLAARSAFDKNNSLIGEGDEKAIAEAAARAPDHQELAVALARLRYGRAAEREAQAALSNLGPTGRQTAAARAFVAFSHSLAGDLTKAEDLAASLVSERLPSFLASFEAYMAEAKPSLEAVREQARAGTAPAGLERASQETLASLLRSLQPTPESPLMKHYRRFIRNEPVLMASSVLANVKLRRAAAAPEGEQLALLKDAERALQAVREPGDGFADVHIPLAKVLFRLGRPRDGEIEMSKALRRGDAEALVGAGTTYQGLGLRARACELAEKAYLTAKDPAWKLDAAQLRAGLASDTADFEAWVARTDPSRPAAAVMKTQLEMTRLLDEGKLAEADRALGALLERVSPQGAPGNTAFIHEGRYEATGDPEHLNAAIRDLEAALAMDADNFGTTSALAAALERAAEAQALSKWLRIEELRLNASEHRELVDGMADGPPRAELLAALQGDARYQRSLALRRRQQHLGPQSPRAYEQEARWLWWSRDTAGLQALHKRLEPASVADDLTADERRRWLSGERDAELGTIYAQQQARSSQRLRRAAKTGHKPTIAAADFLHGAALERTAMITASSTAFEEAAAAFRSASEAWPEGLGAGRTLDALLAVAAYQSFPALRDPRSADRRAYDTPMLLLRLMSDPASAAALTALRERPELAEVVRRTRADVEKEPLMAHFMVARLTGDAALERLATAAFDRADLGLWTKIDALLHPADVAVTAYRDLFINRGKAR